MKNLLTFVAVSILSLTCISAFAAGEDSRQWFVYEDLEFKYTKSCASGEFDSVYIYKETSDHMDKAVAKYENSETCTLVAIVTDPRQQDDWYFYDKNFRSEEHTSELQSRSSRMPSSA